MGLETNLWKKNMLIMFLVGSAGVKHQKDTEKADSVVGAGASRSLLDLCSRAAASDTVQ